MELLFCLALGSFLAWRGKPGAAQVVFAVAAYTLLRLLF